jgi:hypothetical protein
VADGGEGHRVCDGIPMALTGSGFGLVQ